MTSLLINPNKAIAIDGINRIIMAKNTQQLEVDKNYKAFKNLLSELIMTDEGRYALMHKSELIACFDTNRDAQQSGEKLLKGKPFSIQKITEKPVDLGIFSHAKFLGSI